MVHADSFEKLIMPGPVIQGHAKYEQECDKCHQLMSKEEQNRLCLDCHDLIDKDMKTGKGYHGKAKGMKQAPCKSCHIEHKGRDADIVKLDDRLFPHHMTDFSLEGAHKTVNCNRCHQPDKKHREAQGECYLCHKDNPHDGKLGNRCSQCHSQVSWNVMDFDHDKTKFKLTGRHQDTACNSCHINNQYKDTPKTCFSCHSVDDVHHGKNGRECAKCHNTNGWKKLSFNHDKDTKFKLLGRHKSVSCASCHPKDPYKFKIEDSCVSCHKADDRHRGQYGKDCQSCHGFDRWDRIVFNHDRDTRYRLQGKHKEAKCVACHKANIKDKVSTKCLDCHKFDDAHGGKINQKCDTCHSAESWHTSIVFDHDLSGFPLIGLHTIAACDDCHLTRHYKDTSRACNACHNKDDVHKLRLGPQCGDCHNPNAWGVWRFDHDRETRFRLDGAHKKIHCYDCHQEPAKNGIKLGQSCGYCHGRDDPHNNQFGQMCEQCHDTRSFRNVNMLR
ncbi:MAG: cytochrome C [Gammaproteobacteria bacterium]|nr:MAG: cytochrome C [Gammaproteobacteria bacterium]